MGINPLERRNTMDRFQWTTVNGKTVLKQDFSDLGRDEMKDYLIKSHEVIKAKGKRDIVVMTNIRNLKFDRQITKAFEELSKKNKDYVMESAIFGVGTLQKVAIEAVGRLTGRHFNIFREEQEAMHWALHL